MAATLGPRELDVMGVLWRDGPGTAAQVQKRLPANLAYTTVATILRNLEAKGFVGHTAEGRSFHYSPRVTEQAARRNAVSRIADTLFRGSAIDVVTHMVDNEILSEDDIESLYRLLGHRLSSLSRSNDQVDAPCSKGAARTRRKYP